jgi:hypothetical protein
MESSLLGVSDDTLASELGLNESFTTQAPAKFAQYKELALVNYANFIFPTGEERKQICEVSETASPNSFAAETLFLGIEVKHRPCELRGLAWLCKPSLRRFS